MITLTQQERLEIFFEPCQSKEELRQHMKVFLNIDFPNQIIDEDSTSTPLDFVWAVYQTMLTGKGPTNHVVAAARGTTKTLSASVVRFYGLITFRRDGTHLAATEDQSKSANMYLDRFLKIPEISPFVTTSNSKTRELRGLPPNSYTKKDYSILRVAVATVAGVNSQRGSLNTRDEVDLVPPSILSEASFISEPTQDEHQFEPIELNLSSRKSNSGPIQMLLDDGESGKHPNIQIHKWSLVDWMRRCPNEVHKPELPMIPVWMNTENLKLTWGEENYKALSSTDQQLQKEIKAYEGCQTCPAFVVCQARSPNQKGKMKDLRSIQFVADMLYKVRDPDKIIAQALNNKPESSAVVFRAFNRHRHFLEPINAWVWLFGDFFNPHGLSPEEIDLTLKEGQQWQKARITPSKSDIYKKLIETGWTIHYGVDWGYSPDPACCIVVAYHKKQRRAFILHTESALNHSNQDWADHIAREIQTQYPANLVAPDMQDKASPTYFAKHQIPSLDKKPARIETGVSQIRGLLWNVAAQREMMAVLNDGDFGEGKWVAECFERWTYLKTAMGYQFGKFDTDSDYTHPLDSLRYALAPFLELQDVRVSITQPKTDAQTIKAAAEGNAQAIEDLKNMQKKDQEIRSLAMKHFAEQHGLGNVFAAEDRLKQDNADKTNPKESNQQARRSGMKFKF